MSSGFIFDDIIMNTFKTKVLECHVTDADLFYKYRGKQNLYL